MLQVALAVTNTHLASDLLAFFSLAGVSQRVSYVSPFFVKPNLNYPSVTLTRSFFITWVGIPRGCRF